MTSGVVEQDGRCDDCGQSMYLSFILLGATYAVVENDVITRRLCALCGLRHQRELVRRSDAVLAGSLL